MIYNDHYSNPGDATPTSTSSIILELHAGENVTVVNQQSTKIWGLAGSSVYRSWFSGFLLYGL